MGALAKDLRLSYERIIIPTPTWKKGSISYANGTVTASDTSSVRYSDSIEIAEGASHLFCSEYTANGTNASVAFYDAENLYLGGFGGSGDNLSARDKAIPVEIPYNAKYVRFSVYHTASDNWFGEYYKGDVISAIERVKYASEWHNDEFRVMNSSARATTAIYTDVINVSKIGMVSLRLANTFDVPCKIALVNDRTADSTDVMLDSTGNAIQFDAQAGYTTIITPEDAPALKYLNFLKLKVTFTTAPTSGNLKIYAMKKV